MANESLIKGAGFAATNFLNPQAGFVQGLNTPMSEIGRAAMQESAYKRKQDEVELKNYVNKMEDIELNKVEETMRPEVTEFLVENKNNYAEAARMAADLDPEDPRYMEAVSEMNKINSSFKSLSTSLDAFKTKRTEFYADVKKNAISKGSNTDALNAMFKNDDYSIQIDQYGGLSIENEGEFVPLTDFEEDTEYNYFLVNNEAFNSIMTLTNEANSNAVKITGGLETSYKYKLNGMFNTMDREDLMSMVYDTVINDTPLVDGDFDQALLDPENEGELRTFLSNKYLESLKVVAQQSAAQLAIKNRPKESVAQRNARQGQVARMKRYNELALNPAPGMSVQGVRGKSVVWIKDAKGGAQASAALNGKLQPTVTLFNEESIKDWLNN